MDISLAKPTVSIIGSPYVVDENRRFVGITLLVSEVVPYDAVVTVDFDIVSGTAMPQEDYNYPFGPSIFEQQTGTYSGSVTIPGGASFTSVVVELLPDDFVEGDETFTISITDVSPNVQIGPVASTSVTIVDDDVLPAPENVEVTIATTQDAAEPTTAGMFTVKLSQAVSTDTVVNYSVAGTATKSVDYDDLLGTDDLFGPDQVFGTAIIPAGQTMVTIDVAVIDDLVLEGDESVIVTLDSIAAGPTEMVLGEANMATVTIVDDEVPPAVPIAPIPAPASDDVRYRVNAGGPEVAAIDDGPNWLADSAFLIDPGSDNVGSYLAVNPGDTVAVTTPGAIFNTYRFDYADGTPMQYGFDLEAGLYEVRLYFGDGYAQTNDAGERVFDVAIEGTVPTELDDVDPTGDFGFLVGGMISTTVEVTDGTLNIDFLHEMENPMINGIEILRAQPVSSGPLRFEAEDADSIVNYRTEMIEVASAGVALTFLGGVAEESGSVSFVFGDTLNELDGTYDITLGTYDENDGQGFFTVELTDFETGIKTEIGRIDLIENLGSNVPVAATSVTPTVATGISLTAGDIITVNGFERGTEHVRLDYLELTSVR